MTEFIQTTLKNGKTHTHLAAAFGSRLTLCGIEHHDVEDHERVTKPRHHTVECLHCQCIVARVGEYLSGRKS